jgi:hypothetical protein
LDSLTDGSAKVDVLLRQPRLVARTGPPGLRTGRNRCSLIHKLPAGRAEVHRLSDGSAHAVDGHLNPHQPRQFPLLAVGGAADAIDPMSIRKCPVLLETSNGFTPALSVPPTAQPVDVLLALRESRWTAYQIRVDPEVPAWIAKVIDRRQAA